MPEVEVKLRVILSLIEELLYHAILILSNSSLIALSHRREDFRVDGMRIWTLIDLGDNILNRFSGDKIGDRFVIIVE